MSVSRTLQFTTEAENLPAICMRDQYRTSYEGVEYLLNFVSAEAQPHEDKVLVEFDLISRPSSVLSNIVYFDCYPFVEIKEILKHSKGHMCYDKK